MKIIALKLVTGEDILGEEISSDSERIIRLQNPVGITIVAGQDGRPNVGFSPFPLHSEDKTGKTIDIQFAHVVYSYEPAEDFKANYDKIFGSGIVLPNKTLITG